MPIKWLLRKLQGERHAPEPAPAPQPTPEKDGYFLADGEPPLSQELKAAAERAGALALAVNRSMQAASAESDPGRKQQCIKSAREALASVLEIAKKHPAVKPQGLDAVLKDLDRMDEESRRASSAQGRPTTLNDPIQESLASSFHVINESIEIAANTKNADTFASRLDVAEKVLHRAKATARQFGRRVDGISDAEAAIEALKLRGPPIKATKSKRPSKRVKRPLPDAPAPENMRPPELDVSPWMQVAPEDTGIHSAESWAALRDDLRSGNFWADRAKDAREEPVERLRIGLENLPLPGAFKECAIATRALVRTAKKAGEPIDRPLSLLYWLAAIHSFTVPYSRRLGAPGHLAMEMASGSEVAALPFTYRALGYERLELLTITDVKAMVAIWGEPESHSTLHEMHHGFWMECENRAAGHYGRDLLE